MTEAYRPFVKESRNGGSPWEEWKRQIHLGDEAFVDATLAKPEEDTSLNEITTSCHRPPPKPLEHYANTYLNRDDAIVAVCASGGYRLKAIGEPFGLVYSTISGIIKKRTNSGFKP